MVANFVLRRRVNEVREHKTDYLPPQMTVYRSVIPILMHFFTISSFKVYYTALKANTFGNVKPESANEKRRITMTSGSRQSQNIPPQIFDVIKSDVAQYSYVH